MIAIIFTNFSQTYEEADDGMLDGVQSSTCINQKKTFQLLVNKVLKELSEQIWLDQGKTQ